MKRMNGNQGNSVSEINAAIEDVIKLMRSLVLVIEEENRILSQGIPASLTATAARKSELADQFETWVGRVKNAQIRVDAADAAMRAQLMSVTGALREAMNENVLRLKAAMGASRRRVDAIMSAIREQVSGGSSSYGANGRVRGHSVSSVCGVGRSA